MQHHEIKKLYKSGFSSYKSILYRKLILKNLQVKVDCMRNYKIMRNSPVIFFHVPKAAGTAISSRLYGKSILHVKAVEFRKYYPELFKNRFTFALMRCPFERLYSSYRFVSKGGTKMVPVDYKNEYNHPSFSSFEKFVEEWIVDESHRKLDHVFMLQSEFICDGQKMILDHLGKVTRLDYTFDFINSSTFSHFKLPEIKNQLCDIKFDMSSVYNQSMISIVKEIYSKDIELYRSL